jgi:hypothetical protein
VDRHLKAETLHHLPEVRNQIGSDCPADHFGDSIPAPKMRTVQIVSRLGCPARS